MAVEATLVSFVLFELSVTVGLSLVMLSPVVSCRPFRTDFLQTVDRKMRKPCDENKMIEVLMSQRRKIAHI